MFINGLTPCPARRKFHFAERLKTETDAGIRRDLIPPVSSNEALVRTTSAKAKSSSPLPPVFAASKELWHQYHLTYDQTHYVAKEVRRALPIERPNTRRRAVACLSRDEERKLIAHAYRTQGTRGLLVKALFQAGARVPEFLNIRAEELFSDEQMILITKAKGDEGRHVPILPELAQALRTHLGNCAVGCLFETIHHTPFSSRRMQQIIKKTADEAKITKRVYPHLLRHSVATTLLERGMPIEQIQKFLGHWKLETTQIYAESSPEMFKESHQRALAG
jgi:integrase/recombinase XerD